MLVFERGCFLSPPPSAMTTRTQKETTRDTVYPPLDMPSHTDYDADTEAITHLHHPRTRARTLVFEGGCCLPPLPPLGTHHLPPPSDCGCQRGLRAPERTAAASADCGCQRGRWRQRLRLRLMTAATWRQQLQLQLPT